MSRLWTRPSPTWKSSDWNMSKRERELRKLVTSVTSREVVVAKVAPKDVEDFRAGRLTYNP